MSSAKYSTRAQELAIRTFVNNCLVKVPDESTLPEEETCAHNTLSIKGLYDAHKCQTTYKECAAEISSFDVDVLFMCVLKCHPSHVTRALAPKDYGLSARWLFYEVLTSYGMWITAHNSFRHVRFRKISFLFRLETGQKMRLWYFINIIKTLKKLKQMILECANFIWSDIFYLLDKLSFLKSHEPTSFWFKVLS